MRINHKQLSVHKLPFWGNIVQIKDDWKSLYTQKWAPKYNFLHSIFKYLIQG